MTNERLEFLQSHAIKTCWTEELASELRTLRAALAERDQRIGRLEMKLAQRETYITESHVGLVEYVNKEIDELRTLRTSVAEKNARIADLERQLAEARAVLAVGIADMGKIATKAEAHHGYLRGETDLNACRRIVLEGAAEINDIARSCSWGIAAIDTARAAEAGGHP